MPTLMSAERPVTDAPAAEPAEAFAHFQSALAFETDCADVHAALTGGHGGFVVLDVRSPELYAAGHLPGAVNLPHRRINERNLSAFSRDTLFVVYCSGPHCNGADRGALALARLGRRVKKMIGGTVGWLDEGYTLVREAGATSDGGGTAVRVARTPGLPWAPGSPGEAAQ